MMFKYSFKRILSNKIISILFILALCFTISVSMLSINISSQIEESFYSMDKKYDVLVGNKGSDTALIMSSLFLSEDPLGTIPYSTYEILKEKDYKKVVPISIADNYRNSRIVGSTPLLLEDYKIKEGRLFENEFEIVLGYDVAKNYNLNIGDTLVSSHGIGSTSHSHESTPYTVVGILDKTLTSYDSACFTNLESIWHSHEHQHIKDIHNEQDTISTFVDHHDVNHNHVEEDTNHTIEHTHDDLDICAVLIKTGNISKISEIELLFKNYDDIQTVNTTMVLRKIMNNIDFSKQIANILCYIIIGLSILLVIIMSFLMLNSLNKDIDNLEFIGMKDIKIIMYVCYQIIILFLIALSISLLLDRSVIYIASNIASKMGLIFNTSKFYIKELYIVLFVFIFTIVPGIIYSKLKLNKGE